LLRSFTLSRSFNPAVFFFFDTATTEIYPLSLHDALPIWNHVVVVHRVVLLARLRVEVSDRVDVVHDLVQAARQDLRQILELASRSEEHTSELQSRRDLVCRLLLEKKNTGKSRRNSRPPAS